MKVSVSSMIVLGCLGVSLQSPAALASADWGIPDLRPEWAGRSGDPDQVNQSFLSDRDQIAKSSEVKTLEGIFSDRQSAELRQNYRDRFRDYELRAQYGLLDLEQKRKQQEEMGKFSKDVYASVRSKQLSDKREEVRNAAERIGGMKEPVAVLAFILGVYSGEPIEMKVADDTRIRARSEMKDSKGEFLLKSPFFDGSFQMSGNSPESRDPFAPAPDDAIQRAERYKFSLSRALPVFDLSSAVGYGSTTRSLTASVSRPIMDNLTCEVGHARYIRNDRSEGQVKLLYDIRF